MMYLCDPHKDGEPMSSSASARKVRDEWNKRYPEYPVTTKSNLHDFGTYFSVVCSDEVYEKAYEKGFDIESEILVVCDELGV